MVRSSTSIVAVAARNHGITEPFDIHCQSKDLVCDCSKECSKECSKDCCKDCCKDCSFAFVGSAGNSNSDTDLVALLSVIVINLFITMPKRIVLINADGDEMGSAKVVNDSDYLNWLHMKELDILVDNDGDDIPGFGALVDGGRYTGRPRQGDTKIPQQRQQLNHIDAYIAKKEADEATVQISNPGLTKYNRAVQKIGVRFDAPEWNQKPTGLEDLEHRNVKTTFF